MDTIDGPPKGGVNDPDVVVWHRRALDRGAIVTDADIQSVADYVLGQKVGGRWLRAEMLWPSWLSNEIAAHTPIKDGGG